MLQHCVQLYFSRFDFGAYFPIMSGQRYKTDTDTQRHWNYVFSKNKSTLITAICKLITFAFSEYASVVEWYTRRSQNPLLHGLRVQVPPEAPQSKHQKKLEEYERMIKKITPHELWQDYINPPLDLIEEIVARHNFHELDQEAILEENQYARLDTYDDYLFLVLHFPKYEPTTERYISNEMNIFVGKDYILTFRYYQSSTIKRVFSRYVQDLDEGKKVSPAFILYEILDSFLDKTMKMLERVSRDIKGIERDLFTSRSTNTIRNIMNKKRNIITLKHMMKPQISVLKMIELRMKERFSEDVELYYENLEDKLDKIFSEIQLLQENIDSIEDTLKSVFELETNTTIKYLTVFSAFMLPLTLVTSFFGMNVERGHFDNLIIYSSIILVSIIFIVIAYFFVKKRVI